MVLISMISIFIFYFLKPAVHIELELHEIPTMDNADTENHGSANAQKDSEAAKNNKSLGAALLSVLKLLISRRMWLLLP